MISGETMGRELHDLAENLGDLGNLLSVGSVGKSLYRGQYARAGGEVGAGLGDIPTSTAEGLVKVLELVARGAGIAVNFAGAVDVANSQFDVVFKTRSRFVTATVYEVKYCEDGVWKCRTELEIDLGTIRNTDRSRRGNSRRVAQTDARRAATVLNRLKSDTQAILDFINTNQPGPC